MVGRPFLHCSSLRQRSRYLFVVKLRISGEGEERIGVSLEIILRDLTRKVEVRIEIGM